MRLRPNPLPWIVASVAFVFLVDVNTTAAQSGGYSAFGGYPAYGALRGRARTVVRGNVARSRVRWGGGISPQAAGVLTSPVFWTGVGGITDSIGGFLGRSDDLVYLTEDEMDAVRAHRTAVERSDNQRQEEFRADSEKSIREILALHDEMIERLSKGTSPGGSGLGGTGLGGTGLEARTNRFLADAKEIHRSNGDSPKLAPTQVEGRALETRYGEIQTAIQETNAALESLKKARSGS